MSQGTYVRRINELVGLGLTRSEAVAHYSKHEKGKGGVKVNPHTLSPERKKRKTIDPQRQAKLDLIKKIKRMKTRSKKQALKGRPAQLLIDEALGSIEEIEAVLKTLETEHAVLLRDLNTFRAIAGVRTNEGRGFSEKVGTTPLNKEDWLPQEAPSVDLTPNEIEAKRIKLAQEAGRVV